MDVLYTLGKGSLFNNLEIEFSVKLLKKFVKFDRLFVVGEKPNFDCLFIPFRDQLPSAANNVFLKIVKVCEDTDISENFLYMMDDVFVLSSFVPEEYPLYHSGELEEKRPINSYMGQLQETRRFLLRFNKPVLHYGVHCPIVYNKSKIKALDAFYWNYVNGPESKFGLNPRILYGNWFEHSNKAFTKDLKLTQDVTKTGIVEILKDKQWFSVGSRTFGKTIQNYLEGVLNDK